MQVQLRQADVAVLVPFDLRHGLHEVILGEPQGQSLGHDGNAEGAPVRHPLQHRRLQDVRQVLEADGFVLGELLGDHAEGHSRGLPDPDGQVAGRPPHGHDEVPPFRGDGVRHEVVHDVDAEAARRLEAERGNSAGERKIVVDRLGDVRHADRAAGRLGEPFGRIRCVVAADRHQCSDAQIAERLQAVVHAPIRVGGGSLADRRVRSRREEDRTAQHVDPRDVGDGERLNVLDRALD